MRRVTQAAVLLVAAYSVTSAASTEASADARSEQIRPRSRIIHTIQELGLVEIGSVVEFLPSGMVRVTPYDDADEATLAARQLVDDYTLGRDASDYSTATWTIGLLELGLGVGTKPLTGPPGHTEIHATGQPVRSWPADCEGHANHPHHSHHNARHVRATAVTKCHLAKYSQYAKGWLYQHIGGNKWILRDIGENSSKIHTSSNEYKTSAGTEAPCGGGSPDDSWWLHSYHSLSWAAGYATQYDDNVQSGVCLVN